MNHIEQRGDFLHLIDDHVDRLRLRGHSLKESFRPCQKQAM